MEDRIYLDWIEAMGAVLKKKIIWIQFKPMVKPGDNYISILSRVTLAYRQEDESTGDGTEATLSVVLKVPQSHENPTVRHSLDAYFKAETMMYSSVFKVYENLIKDKSHFDLLWPKCYYISSTNTLILEDLKTNGFELPRELSMMSEDHALLMMQAMGRFHGLSTVAVESGQLNPSGDSRFIFFFTEKGLGDSFVLTGLQSVANAIRNTWGPEWRPMSEKLLKLREGIMDELRSMEKQPARVKVINHGDIWNRNVMFSYCEGKPKEIRFVDYQNPHYNCFAYDVCQFLYACISLDLRLRICSEFLDVYLDSFRDTVTSLGYDVALSPTKQELVQELNRLEILGLIICCTVIPLNFYSGDVEVSFEDYMDLEPGRDTKDTRSRVYENPFITNILKDNLIYFESINLLK